MKSIDRELTSPAGVADRITGDGAEQAVLRFLNLVDLDKIPSWYKAGLFFDELNLMPGKYKRGNKLIEITKDDKEEILKATTFVNGVVRAVINSYNRNLCAAYFMLLGEADANGNRDELVYNRGVYGGGEIDLFRGPGVNLKQKELVAEAVERQRMASHLGVQLDFRRPRILIIKG